MKKLKIRFESLRTAGKGIALFLITIASLISIQVIAADDDTNKTLVEVTGTIPNQIPIPGEGAVAAGSGNVINLNEDLIDPQNPNDTPRGVVLIGNKNTSLDTSNASDIGGAQGAVGLGEYNVVSGGPGSAAIGANNKISNGRHGILALGYLNNVLESSYGTTAIGYNNLITNGTESGWLNGATAIGSTNKIEKNQGIAIGSGNKVSGEKGIVIGYGISHGKPKSIALGYGTNSNGSNNPDYPNSSTGTNPNPAVVISGAGTEAVVGVGTTSPQSMLHVKGRFQLEKISTAAPEASSCNDTYKGKIELVMSNPRLGPLSYLYVCMGSAGWKKAVLE